ncbi:MULTISPECIES: FliC/FljB family flagellin [Morganella]|uniref:FliC/FljB family flagellin n=1 Tax=Morganella TaxID=581 RepID=UPI000409ED51|nr:FliC/FljB family flagellin [Morganella morganii]EKW3934602.1 FliC/FljB family flagellin [Morganella morganii]EKW3939306.1 FliC/FljB family flagellin [Morganella morganii]ELA7708455.1 FliC/FljB family flagellin [Morganella morganii]ELA7734750.1 FliC/FljB family flagellin [Morganella morganii]MBT0310518.1 FliC/FljB family flagellin [Morganella morganii subsp. morganii]
MAQVINTNILSLVTQNNLNRSQGVLGTAIERLSSGARINSAKDDAAGQAIANRFTANVRGLTQASRNASDGISLAQVTEGAINEINDNIQRIRELGVQAKNSTNSASDINSIKEEVDQRLAEIDRISEQTQFNGIKVLSGDKKMSFQVGTNDGETIDIDLKKVDREALGLKDMDFSTLSTVYRQEGAARKAGDFKDDTGTIAAKKMVFTGVKWAGTAPTEVKEAKDENGKAIKDTYLVTGKIDDGKGGTKDVTYEATVKVEKDSGGTDYQATVNVDTSHEIQVLAAGTKPPADEILKTLDDALTKVDTQRSQLGAFQNRMQSTINNLNNSVNNLSAARSRIQDADFATEVSNMSRGQILQQAGTAVLAQANQVPQSVLSLLR